MGREGATQNAAGALRSSFLGALFFCAISIGCDNSCVIFVSNPSNGTISVNASTCSLNKVANATVRVRLVAAKTPVATQGPADVQRIIVTIQGVEARLASTGNEISPDWQELAPELAKNPVQVDLVSDSEDSDSAKFLGEGQVRAGAYAELRLLLLRDTPPEGKPVPEKNACGGAGFNCVVAGSMGIRPLVLPDPRVLIPASQISGGVFNALPETNTNLDVELSPSSSLTYSLGSALVFNPVFAARSEFSSFPDADLRRIPMNP